MSSTTSKNNTSNSTKTVSTADPKKSVNTTTTSTGSENLGLGWKWGAKQLNFTISCRGLKPNTKHDFFYKNTRRNDDCRSLMPGQQINSSELISDSAGRLEFRFLTRVSIVRIGSQEKIQEPPGDALFEVRGQNSSAKALVQFKDF